MSKPYMQTIQKTILAAAVMVLSAASAYAQSYTLAPLPYQWVLDTSMNPVAQGCVWTYQAGTSTAIATYADNAGTPNGNPIIADNYGRFVAYLVPGQSYKFVYEGTPCSAPSTHGTVYKTQDNIAAVPASAANVDITGTAGETLSAGQVVYLSDGSGGKNAGQWYKADTTNAYSSNPPELGIVPSTITSGSSGSIRIAGYITGLSSLVAGSDYYLTNTAGSISATVGTRYVGRADTTTSLVLTPNPRPPLENNAIVQGRLTLTSGSCVTTSDVTAATTLYFTPCGGNQITLYDGLASWHTFTFSELSIAVPATTSQMYDVWIYNNAGTPALELLAWTNDTTRATALAKQDGVYVKTGATTRRYVGSFRTTAVSGQTEDSLAKRYVWNYYNRVIRPLRRIDTTDSWTYGTTSYQQANASAANQVDVVIGVNEVQISLTLVGLLNSSSAAGATASVAIGEDSTTTPVSGQIGMPLPLIASNTYSTQARYDGYPAVGRHFYAWLERGTGAGTDTWFGDNGNPTRFQSGLSGFIVG